MNIAKYHVISDEFNLDRTSGGSASRVRDFSNLVYLTDCLKNELVENRTFR